MHAVAVVLAACKKDKEWQRFYFNRFVACDIAFGLVSMKFMEGLSFSFLQF